MITQGTTTSKTLIQDTIRSLALIQINEITTSRDTEPLRNRIIIRDKIQLRDRILRDKIIQDKKVLITTSQIEVIQMMVALDQAVLQVVDLTADLQAPDLPDPQVVLGDKY